MVFSNFSKFVGFMSKVLCTQLWDAVSGNILRIWLAEVWKNWLLFFKSSHGISFITVLSYYRRPQIVLSYWEEAKSTSVV